MSRSVRGRGRAKRGAGKKKERKKKPVFTVRWCLVRAVPRRKGLAGPSLYISRGDEAAPIEALPFQSHCLLFADYHHATWAPKPHPPPPPPTIKGDNFSKTKKKRQKSKVIGRKGAGLTFPTQGRRERSSRIGLKIRQFWSGAIGLETSQSQSLTFLKVNRHKNSKRILSPLLTRRALAASTGWINKSERARNCTRNQMASRNDSIFPLIPFLPLPGSWKARDTVCGCGRETGGMITVWARFRAASGPQHKKKKNKRSRPMLLAQYHRSWLWLSLAQLNTCVFLLFRRSCKKKRREN